MSENPNVPTGQYPQSEAVHFLDLENAADQLLGERAGKSQLSRNLAREGGVSVVMMAMEAGAAVREHSAKGVVTVQCLRGQVALAAGAAEFELRQGQLVMLRPNVRHDVRAVQQSVIVLTITGGE